MGLASSIRAITPAASGVALEVPPKSSVTLPELEPPEPVMSVVVMPSPSPSECAATRTLAPGSAYQDWDPSWFIAVTAIVYLLFAYPS